MRYAASTRGPAMLHTRMRVYDADGYEVGWVTVPIFEHRTAVPWSSKETVIAFGHELELHRSEPERQAD